MFCKTIAYTDYNGQERNEQYWFNLSEAELLDLELGTSGGISNLIKQIMQTKNTPELMKLFKKFILASYGEKSLDGKYFMKEDDEGRPLYNKFKHTEAFSQLYVELATNDEAAAEFINHVVPEARAEAAQKAMAENPDLMLIK